MRRRMTALLGLAGFLGLQASAWGQTIYNWNDPTGGSFHTASNWSPAGGPPGALAIADFNIAGTYTVTFANNNGQSLEFNIRRGDVTFTSAVANASHSWGFSTGPGDIGTVGPGSGDVATSSTLNLVNMPNFMAGEWIYIGHAAGKAGTMNIANAGWVSTGTSIVGFAGQGNLNITTSGSGQDSFFVGDRVQVGASGLGIISVSGINARVVASSLEMGTNGGRGIISVSNEGLADFGSATIGKTVSESHSQVTVSGFNSRMVIDNDLIIADGASVGSTDGKLFVQSGGRVTVGQQIILGVESASAGTMSINGTSFNGTGAAVIAQGPLTIGKLGQGTVNVGAGGRLEASMIALGEAVGGLGEMSVFFDSSAESGQLIVGQHGVGNVEVYNNSVLTSTASSYIGLETGSQGSVSVFFNGRWNARTIYVGYRGNGQLSVDGVDSIVTSMGLLVGNNSNAASSGSELGTILVQNQARLLNTGVLHLGYTNHDHSITVRSGGLLQTGALTIGEGIHQGRGRLTIETGGQVISNGGTLATALGNMAFVTVNGNGSSWNASGTNALDIGQYGIGVVSVENGATLSASNGSLGMSSTGIGTLNLNGLGSSASFAGTLGVGGTSAAAGGSGTVHINNSTTLSVAGQLSLWSGGTINLNAGTLNVGSIAFNGGNWNWNEGTVNFSQPTTLNNALLNNLVGTAHTISPNRILGSTSGAAMTLASNLTVDGGRLQSGGATQVNAGTILMISNGGEASSTGLVTNLGTILMNGPTSTMSGNTIDNRGSIRGSGVIKNTLSNNTTGQVRVAASDWLTFNGNGHVNQGSVQLLGGVLEFSTYLNTGSQGFISGHGTLLTSSASQGGLGLVNTGTFAFSGGNTNIYGDVQNNTTGRIVTSGGSVTTFHDDVLHNGVEIRTSSGASTVFFGDVSGAGAFTGAGLVQFEGDLRPGNSPANVQFAGDVDFSVTARLISELGGVLPGNEYDRLTVQGQILLSGQLDVQLINGFIPNAGDAFMIIDNQGRNSVVGTFAGLAEGASFVSNGQLWNITYQGGTGNDVLLLAVPEPTTWALIGMTILGGAGLGWYRRRRVDADVDMIEHKMIEGSGGNLA